MRPSVPSPMRSCHAVDWEEEGKMLILNAPLNTP